MHQLGALALQAIQLIARNHPHRAVRCAIRPCQPRWKPECSRRAVHAPIRFAVDQSIEGADQQAPPRIEHHARKAALQWRVIVRRGIVEVPIRPQAAQPMPFEQQPHAAFSVHGHGMDQRLRPLPLPLPLPLPPLPIGSMPDQVAACIAQPQRAIAIYVECADAVIGQPRARAAVDHAEFQPVVAHQAFPGCKPQIPVAGLGDVAQGVVRQPVARTPAIDGVIAQACRSGR